MSFFMGVTNIGGVPGGVNRRLLDEGACCRVQGQTCDTGGDGIDSRRMKARDPRPTATDDPWQAATEYGCDMPLLKDAMRRSPAERVAAHRSALRLAVRLRAAKERADARS